MILPAILDLKRSAVTLRRMAQIREGVREAALEFQCYKTAEGEAVRSQFGFALLLLLAHRHQEGLRVWCAHLTCHAPAKDVPAPAHLAQRV